MADWSPVTVYPRVCGGTCTNISVVNLPTGSIPACAGEPLPPSRRASSRQVYPRVCGGTHHHMAPGHPGQGLSPRVRGNPRPRAPRHPPPGSIPACAGEPSSTRPRRPTPRVYPRVCGGTADRFFGSIVRGGLSPRVRGNRAYPRRTPRGGGSIPACAGEPTTGRGGSPSRRVYPRVCGGTYGRRSCQDAVPGLSPRVRGNPLRRAVDGDSDGSIPACAGEPFGCCHVAPIFGVYPRVCGGTRACVASSAIRRGSIPACAGEPAPASPRGCPRGVYPRVCGGTWRCCSQGVRGYGLSPRVRGNPWRPTAPRT